MAKTYKAKRRTTPQARALTPWHFGWMTVCIILVAVLGGMWTQLQSVTHQNVDLKKQLTELHEPADTCKVVGSWSADQSKSESITVGSTQRNYLIHMPDSFKPNKYYPLVMFYVGRGSSAQGAELAYDLDDLPAIVIYPVPTVGLQNMTAWEGAPYSSGADDVAMTSSILNKVESDLCIDRTRVYATGMSNGGGFASLLSCQLSDKFAAYAIVAGAMYPPEGSCTPPVPTPLISIHGDRDPTVPYYGSLTRQLPPIESWVNMRASANRCATRPTTTYPAANLVLTTWNNCQDDAEVQNVRVEGGGHVWGAVPNNLIWQFLSRFSL